MNDNQTLETFLDFNQTRGKKKQRSFQDLCSSSEQSQNQRILHSFKQLRNQLKMSQRQNEELKEKMKISEIKLRQGQQQLNAVLQSNLNFKNQLKKQSESHQQLKLKFTQLKETLSSLHSIQEQLQFTKNALLQAKLDQHKFSEERSKLMEISLNEKLTYEQDILKFQAKSKSSQEYIQQLQSQLAKSKELNIKLQNQLRKITISFQEESFNKKWSRENFQTQHLLQKIEDYQKQISSIKLKNKKEKEKRQILEEKLLQFQQLSGVNQVKAEAYETQADLLIERQAKYVKKIASLNKKLQTKNDQILEIQKKSINLFLQIQDFISKLKDESPNNLVQAAFQFYSKAKSLMTDKGAVQESQLTAKAIKESQKKTKQFNQCYFSQKANSSNQAPYKKADNIPNNDKYCLNQYTFRLEEQKENQVQEILGIQHKIRKERDEMQRKIKEKYFQKKIQASMPSQKHKLRGQYITTFINYH